MNSIGNIVAEHQRIVAERDAELASLREQVRTLTEQVTRLTAGTLEAATDLAASRRECEGLRAVVIEAAFIAPVLVRKLKGSAWPTSEVEWLIIEKRAETICRLLSPTPETPKGTTPERTTT